MPPIVLDTMSRGMLLAQRKEAADGVPAPVRWHRLLDSLSRDATGLGADGHWRRALSGQARLFAWGASREALAAAAIGGSLVYLCWGVPRRGGLKDRMFASLLKRARHVLVNDTTTQAEIAAFCGRETALVPFYIDPEFFTFAPLEGRGDFLFCNGSNDRDGAVVLALAQRGFKVVWLVNDPAVRAHYQGRCERLELRSGISHSQLRSLNQTCAAAIMPISADRHCAGQTTGLEAVASGAPLLVSSGRTASIFSGLPSVSVVEGDTCDGWADAVARALMDPISLGLETVQARALIEQRLSRERFRLALAPFFGWPDASGRSVRQTAAA